MFEDIIGTKKQIRCKKCGSDNTISSIKIYGIAYQRSNITYNKYKQFVRCFTCNSVYVIKGTDIIDNTSVDVINTDWSK